MPNSLQRPVGLAQNPSREAQGVSPESARKTLGDSPLFRGLAPSERNALIARVKIRTFAAGDTIFLMGSVQSSVMAIIDGEVKVSISADGKEAVLAILQPGEVFGEIAMLDGKPRSADATAQRACTLAVLERRDVLAALERSPAAWLGLVELLCSRLRQTDQHLVEIAFLGLPARLAKLLLRVIEEDPRTNVPSAHLSQSELANMVGAARENVNKCLQEWQRAGIIQMKTRFITVTNRVRLEAVAQSDYRCEKGAMTSGQPWRVSAPATGTGPVRLRRPVPKSY
jgi:CRP-like cAMP-binding protein